MRQSNDPTMTSFSRSLSQIKFDGGTRVQFVEAVTSGNKFRACYRSAWGWQCRLFLAGGQRLIGWLRGEDFGTGNAAVRYADAALLYFWKYRRTRREPMNDDFNFSLIQAQNDLDEIVGLSQLLGRIERHLIDKYALAVPSPVRTQEEKTAIDYRHEVIQDWIRLQKSYRRLKFTSTITEAKTIWSIADECLDNLHKCLTSLDSALRTAGQKKVVDEPIGVM